jgi:hypothetical protein
MADVVELSDYKPHLCGEARCLSCGNQWVAVAPVGTVELECGECGTMRGVWRQPIVPDDPLWGCGNCGNDLWYATPSGMYCARCLKVSNYEDML